MSCGIAVTNSVVGVLMCVWRLIAQIASCLYFLAGRWWGRIIRIIELKQSNLGNVFTTCL